MTLQFDSTVSSFGSGNSLQPVANLFKKKQQPDVQMWVSILNTVLLRMGQVHTYCRLFVYIYRQSFTHTHTWGGGERECVITSEVATTFTIRSFPLEWKEHSARTRDGGSPCGCWIPLWFPEGIPTSGSTRLDSTQDIPTNRQRDSTSKQNGSTTGKFKTTLKSLKN